MKCISCDIPRKFSNICNKCMSNAYVMISRSDVIKEYHLTQKEIDDANLFNVFVDTYNTNNVYSSFGEESNNQIQKYLRLNIQALAEKLTKDLPETNRKRKICLKKKAVIDWYIGEINEKKRRRWLIEDTVKCLISKYDEKNIHT